MVNEVLRSGSGAPTDPVFGSIPTPWGFVARFRPSDLAGYWIEVVHLGDRRTGVLVGRCASPADAERLRSASLAALLQTGNPVQSLSGMEGSTASALCAVIDRESISYSSYGQPGGVIAAPGITPMLLDCTDGQRTDLPLDPGATVLLCSGAVDQGVELLDGCSGVDPEELADRVVVGLDHAAAVLYRHPPQPLSITLPADPWNLSISRGKLRDWLIAAGLDSETRGDVLLAVGEATANSTEHAVVDAPGQVDITVDARFESGALRLSVSDNGRWKPAEVSPGHRGHGLRLMKALVNSVEFTTAPQGTTVTMVKELPR